MGLPANPRRGDHDAIWRAWRASHDARTAWRMAYDLPHNDPRVLSADEDEILQDLIVLRYHSHARLRQADPRAADAIDRMANEPTLREQYADLEHRARGPEMQTRLARFLRAVAREDDGGDTGSQVLTRLRVRAGTFGAT